MNNQAQLITYPDSLGGDLPALHHLLKEHFSELFPGGVHLLPPFPSSGDRGFAPRTYFEIDPRFGSWDDLRRLGRDTPLMLDLMVNHLSRQSPYFLDYARRGRASPYAGLFLPVEKVWPGGRVPPEDLGRIFLRRPEHPFIDIPIGPEGRIERLWATFGTRTSAEQIDLDVQSAATRRLLVEILAYFRDQQVSRVRLDAIAYVIKKAGTSCFFVEPEIDEFLDWIQGEAASLGIELLPEVHARPGLQARLAQRGLWVYDFALPLLVLHTFMSGSAAALAAHLRACPRRQVTQLDCHDGIPVQPDTDGLLAVESAQRVVQACLERGANLSRILSPAHQLRPGFDAHQINITYYSALGRSDPAYLAARAIQLFAPGAPQIYYVGLLAGENAPGEIERTGERRALNRRNYSIAEVEQALSRPVVQRLLELIRFRNRYPAFAGDFLVEPAPDRELRLAWEQGPYRAALRVDLPTQQAAITFRDDRGEERTL